MLDGTQSVGHIAATIVDEYDAPAPTVRADVDALLTELFDLGSYTVRHDPRHVCTAAVLVPGFRAIVKSEGLRTAAHDRHQAGRRAAPVRPRPPTQVEHAATPKRWPARSMPSTRRLPVRSKCLPRSLALWTMLQRAGIDATLRIGMRTDGSGEAHAWVEHDGCPVGEEVDPDALAAVLVGKSTARRTCRASDSRR